MGAPVATTTGGKGTFNETNRWALCLRRFWSASSEPCRWQRNADVVLIVGSKLAPTDTADHHTQLLDPMRQTLIQIDIEPTNAAWTYPVDHVVIGDASVVLTQLLTALNERGTGANNDVSERLSRLEADRLRLGWFDVPESESEEIPILPQRLIKHIQESCPNDAFITCDAGENRVLWASITRQRRRVDSYSRRPRAEWGTQYQRPSRHNCSRQTD